jgi:hypothetical protein
MSPRCVEDRPGQQRGRHRRRVEASIDERWDPHAGGEQSQKLWDTERGMVLAY